jgi:anionic cell wall polymer biosynthesis LytR-Cps2A-Psr (LCP) family protein
MSKKLIALIILIILIAGAGLVISHYYSQGKEKFEGNYNVLLLCVDTSEQRPGAGAVDMAFVVNVNGGKVINMTPVYPGGLAHPTLSPTSDMKSYGINKYYLHDSLWTSDVEKGSKIAQETVEYNTGLKTDLVIIVTPESIDAIIQAVGPINVAGQGQVTGNSIDFLREEQNENGVSRGSAVQSLMEGIKTAVQDPNNRKALMETVSAQYSQGHLYVIPADVFQQFVVYEGINNLF